MTDKRSAGSDDEAPATSQAEPDRLLHGSEGPEVGGDTQANAPPETADMQAFIGRQLRAVFDDVAKQPIPDRFIELMKQLDAKPDQH